MSKEVSYHFGAFALLNVTFAALVGVVSVAGGYPDPRVIYLILLFALCSSVVIDLDGLNGRNALLALFMFVYFVSYGVGDVSNLLGRDVAGSGAPKGTSVLPSKAECIILAGCVMLNLGYRLAAALVTRRTSLVVPRDWRKRTIIIVGLLVWSVGIVATYRWNVYIVKDTTNEAYRKGIASLDGVTVTGYVLGQMCQPLGMLLLAYAFTVYRGVYLTAIIVAIVVLQMLIGFVIDVKGTAMLGMILVIMTSVVVDGRLPKLWLAAGVLFVMMVYPYFTAYRAAVHGAGIARSAVVANFGSALEKTAAAKDKVNSGRERAQTFLERSNVKGSVQVVAEKAGSSVAFQGGHTLAPMLTAFIPKLVWSGKARVATGQLFNKQFHIDDSDDIYISPSHLGELYWNFGWAGAVIGMAVIGLLCGWVGTSFNLAEYVTVTRVLITVITIKQMIVGFEGGISDIYVVWMRSLALIGLLHLVFARVPVTSRLFGGTRVPPPVPAGRLFPHLLT